MSCPDPGPETRYREVQRLAEITSRVNAGLLLDEILGKVYRNSCEFNETGRPRILYDLRAYLRPLFGVPAAQWVRSPNTLF